MTTEQLNQARADSWRQAGNPLLTADDATEWLRETGFCLFLPLTQLPTAAPSFVEAVLGASDPAPSRSSIETATGLLHRLIASGDAIALNLLSTPGDQPDFLATAETLPFVFALAGDKEWKRGPRGKSSPLVIEVWKLLDRESPLTAIEVKEKLGRQLTEAAAMRALTDLWSHLRIEPIYKENESPAWQLLERDRQKQMQAGSTMSQAVALSALVSLYLQTAVAASAEEIEVFLSPLVSRSKVREVVKGLTATRQLSTLNLGPVEMYHVEGSLPEFAEVTPAAGLVVATPVVQEESGMGEGRRRFVANRLSAGGEGEATGGPPKTKSSGARPAWPVAHGRSARSFGKPAGLRSDRSTGPASNHGDVDRAHADRRPFAPRPGAAGGERRPYGTRAPGGSSFSPREPWKEERKPSAPHGNGGRPFAPRQGVSGARNPGEPQPFSPRAGSERKPFAPRTGDRPFKPQSGAKPFAGRKPFSPRAGSSGAGSERAGSPRTGSPRKPFVPRESGGGQPKSFAPRPGERPSKPRSDAKPFGDRKPFSPPKESQRKPFAPRQSGVGEGKPFAPRDGDRPFKPRSGAKPFGERKNFGERKTFTPREGGSGERRPFETRAGDRPFKPRAGGRPGEPGSGKPGAGERDRRPAGARPAFAAGGPANRPSSPASRKVTGFRKTTSASRARTSPLTSTGKPRSGVKPPAGRPGPRASRPRAARPRATPSRPAARGAKRTGPPGKGRSQ